MNGIIIIFRLPPKTKNASLSKFCQKFYGQDTSSHGGKYRYRRRGLLDEIPYRKLLRGVLIVRTEDADRVVAFLKTYTTEINIRTINLIEEDFEKLDIPIDSLEV